MNFKNGDIVLNLTDFKKTILADDKYGRGAFLQQSALLLLTLMMKSSLLLQGINQNSLIKQ